MYFFLDLETTGLDPGLDSILEIAAVAVDESDGRTLGWATHIIHPYGWDGAIADAFVHEMHTHNGLIADINSGKGVSLSEAEAGICAFMDRMDGGAAGRILAGNSIHFDRAFIKKWMPTLERTLSHRLFDVSTLKMFFGCGKSNTAPAHRALDDALESLASWKALRGST